MKRKCTVVKVVDYHPWYESDDELCKTLGHFIKLMRRAKHGPTADSKSYSVAEDIESLRQEPEKSGSKQRREWLKEQLWKVAKDGTLHNIGNALLDIRERRDFHSPQRVLALAAYVSLVVKRKRKPTVREVYDCVIAELKHQNKHPDSFPDLRTIRLFITDWPLAVSKAKRGRPHKM